MSSPKVSVIMKVYNSERYLREAIDSVLNQTFTDYEFLILDDASSDSSVEIINGYSDKRIRLLQNAENLGIVVGQNRLISEAKGEYIAVLDSDDISYPERLEKQVAFLDLHKDYILCASYRNEIKDGVYTQDVKLRHLKDETLRFALFFTNPITHSSIMFRKSMYEADDISYGPEPIAEDYGAIVDMAANHPIRMLPERLVAYRVVDNSISRTKADELERASINIRTRLLDKIDISENDKSYIKMYYNKTLMADDVRGFMEAFQRLADKVGADICPGGNAFWVAVDIFTDLIQTVNSYNMKMWKLLRDSDIKHLTSIKTDLGRKLLAASLLHIKRRG